MKKYGLWCFLSILGFLLVSCTFTEYPTGTYPFKEILTDHFDDSATQPEDEQPTETDTAKNTDSETVSYPETETNITDPSPVYFASIPDYIYVPVQDKFNIYFRNVLSADNVHLLIGTHQDLSTEYGDDHLSIVPMKEGTHTLGWKICDENQQVIDEGMLHIVASSSIPEPTRILVIGDSTINAGIITNTLLSLYRESSTELTLLGSRGSAPNCHEGRSGWSARTYCTKAKSGDIENPFYNNGGFDFSHYMNSQEYDSVDTVVLQLGINDIFPYGADNYSSTSALNYMQQIIDSVLLYNPNIHIVIDLPITPNGNSSTFYETYGESQSYEVYNRNIIRFASELHHTFVDAENVTICAINCVLDTMVHIKDGVHPTNEGYRILAKTLFDVLATRPSKQLS